MNRKLSASEKSTLLSSLPIARKWLHSMLNEGYQLSALESKHFEINQLEKKFYGKWKQQMLKKMKRKRYQNKAAYYFLSLSCPVVNYDKIISKCKKYIILTEDKDLKHLLGLLIHFKRKIKNFQKYAYEMLIAGETPERIYEKAETLDKQEEIDNENKLYVIQTLKHIRFLQDCDIPATLELLRIGLNAKFSYDPEVLDAQSEVVMKTYKAVKDPGEAYRIKMFCYDFIAQSFITAERTDANLIKFFFLGGTVSEETFRTLFASYKAIHKNSMEPLVYNPIKPLAEKVIKKSILSDSDKYILSIAARFDPKNQQTAKEKMPLI